MERHPSAHSAMESSTYKSHRKRGPYIALDLSAAEALSRYVCGRRSLWESLSSSAVIHTSLVLGSLDWRFEWRHRSALVTAAHGRLPCFTCVKEARLNSNFCENRPKASCGRAGVIV